ncbi:uncharacterized protein LOC129583618 isoform X2 [Paramacrobiotus metropolitanus]|uniref:uncharacterized protein LOC129583618 isoform X2 n=1 Tax=Paramacrobiotus metropolitanus TaxID=2943436 RepID=UPI0024463A96|nr:uncharacterized protein LOC129583618 isoform X2 [Paramacrobiotus metropolitanus]
MATASGTDEWSVLDKCESAVPSGAVQINGYSNWNDSIMDNQLQKSGQLSYQYLVMEQQISSTLENLVKKMLPGHERYTKFIVRKPSVSATERFEKAYQRWQATKEAARLAEETAVQQVEKAEGLLRSIQLYRKMFDVLMEIAENVSVRISFLISAPPSAPRSLNINTGKNGLLSSQATSARPVSFYKGQPPTGKRKTMKPKVPLKPEYRPIEEAEFQNVSEMVRGKVKLSDVNMAYQVLYQAFCDEELPQIKLSELAKRGIGVSGRTEMAKLKVLRQLGRIVLSSDLQFITPGNL